MKKTLIALLLALSLGSCGTKYNFVDTGKSNPYFPGDMYEYLQSKPYDWDLIVQVIDRAELQDVFRNDDITFLGLTSHSIRKWLLPGGAGHDTYKYSQVSDIPVEICRRMVLSLVIDGKVLRDEIERIEMDEKGNRIGGGRKVVSRYGNRIWLWTKQNPYGGVEGVGPIVLSITSLREDNKTEIATNTIASTNIQPTNGVVHALEYSYNVDNIGPIFSIE